MKLTSAHPDFGYETVKVSRFLPLTTTDLNEPSNIPSTNQPEVSAQNVPRGGLEESPLQEDSSITQQWQEQARQGIMGQFLLMNQSQSMKVPKCSEIPPQT